MCFVTNKGVGTSWRSLEKFVRKEEGSVEKKKKSRIKQRRLKEGKYRIW
jgi:hypothetical protein